MLYSCIFKNLERHIQRHCSHIYPFYTTCVYMCAIYVNAWGVRWKRDVLDKPRYILLKNVRALTHALIQNCMYFVAPSLFVHASKYHHKSISHNALAKHIVHKVTFWLIKTFIRQEWWFFILNIFIRNSFGSHIWRSVLWSFWGFNAWYMNYIKYH